MELNGGGVRQNRGAAIRGKLWVAGAVKIRRKLERRASEGNGERGPSKKVGGVPIEKKRTCRENHHLRCIASTRRAVAKSHGGRGEKGNSSRYLKGKTS